MISEQYGREVELQIADDLFPVRDTAVEDILNSIGKTFAFERSCVNEVIRRWANPAVA